MEGNEGVELDSLLRFLDSERHDEGGREKAEFTVPMPMPMPLEAGRDALESGLAEEDMTMAAYTERVSAIGGEQFQRAIAWTTFLENYHNMSGMDHAFVFSAVWGWLGCGGNCPALASRVNGAGY